MPPVLFLSNDIQRCLSIFSVEDRMEDKILSKDFRILLNIPDSREIGMSLVLLKWALSFGPVIISLGLSRLSRIL